MIRQSTFVSKKERDDVNRFMRDSAKKKCKLTKKNKI